MLDAFENLHPNHKYAYLDGFLCGIVVAIIVKQYVNDYREMKAQDRRIEEFGIKPDLKVVPNA